MGRTKSIIGRVKRKFLRALDDGRSALPAHFNEQHYRLLNPDVDAAIVRGEVASGQDHYLAQGHREGRLYSMLDGSGGVPSSFREDIYLQLNPDVAEAVTSGQVESGRFHFLQAGQHERRVWEIPAAVMDLKRSLAELEARVKLTNEALAREARRVDWALAGCEGLAQQISDYQAARLTEDYQSAFQLSEPLVSVCVATFNRSELLVERALRSLREQSYSNLQIVVVGDHCTDDTEQRITALRDDRIVFDNLSKHGPYPAPGEDRWMVAGSNAMNHALSLCEGQFVAHLDDDDEAMPERIEELVAAAKETRADFIWHPFSMEHPDGSWTVIGRDRLMLGEVTTGSIFYHRYFASMPWDVHAYRLGEPGDWNRIRKIKHLRPRLHFLPKVLMRHYRQGTQSFAPVADHETFLS